MNRGFIRAALLALLAGTWLPAAGHRKPRPRPKPPARTQILHPKAIAPFLDALARL